MDDAALVMTELELSYIAGLFDGEGSIGIYKRTSADTHVLRVSITNTNIRLMVWISDRLNGRVKEVGSNKYRKHKCYQWIAENHNALVFLEKVRPFLIAKATQADVGMMFRRVKETYSINGRKLNTEEFETEAELKKLLDVAREADAIPT